MEKAFLELKSPNSRLFEINPYFEDISFQEFAIGNEIVVIGNI